jgi:uncharacterized membrane protein YdjX (TVP38/TMEM64 family)
VKIIAPALIFVALFLAWRYTPLADVIAADHVVAWARSLRKTPWAALALIAAYTPAAFVMFPRPIITLLAVVAFGPWCGFLLSIVGIIGSALATYAVGRSLPEKSVHRLAGRNLERATRAIRRRGLASVFAVSIAPVAPFPVIGMMAGNLRITLWEYVLGTVFGMIPGTLATTVFAHQIEAALEDPTRINYWVIGGVIAIFVALVLIVRRWMLSVREEA